MSMPERYHPECPPDAHKVIRPPLKEVHALLCVKVNDTEEANGMDNVCDILSLMNKKPLIVCSEKMKELIKASAAQAEIEPEFVVVHENNKASISYADGSVSNTFDYYDFADIQKDYLKHLEEKCLICLDTMSMFTLRSISTVFPQYIKARSELTDSDIKLLEDVRYGRFDALKVEEESKTAYQFLRLERKLFLQYPTEDD